VAGNIFVTRQIEANPNEPNIVNFCFGTPVATGREVQISEKDGVDNQEKYPLDTSS
jgi:hypothetical protein